MAVVLESGKHREAQDVRIVRSLAECQLRKLRTLRQLELLVDLAIEIPFLI